MMGVGRPWQTGWPNYSRPSNTASWCPRVAAMAWSTCCLAWPRPSRPAPPRRSRACFLVRVTLLCGASPAPGILLWHAAGVWGTNSFATQCTGYSDITALHCAWWRYGWGESLYGFLPAVLHGPRARSSTATLCRGHGFVLNAGTVRLPGVPDARASQSPTVAAAAATDVQSPPLLQEEEEEDSQPAAVVVLHPGVASGPCFAACLRVLAGLCGTPWQPLLTGCVLALEDVDERPYRVDRDLEQLMQSGMLTGVVAVVLGSFRTCVDPDGRDCRAVFEARMQLPPLVSRAGFPSLSLFWFLCFFFACFFLSFSPVAQSWAARLRVPMLWGLPFGHEADPITLPIGRRVTVTAAMPDAWQLTVASKEQAHNPSIATLVRMAVAPTPTGGVCCHIRSTWFIRLSWSAPVRTLVRLNHGPLLCVRGPASGTARLRNVRGRRWLCPGCVPASVLLPTLQGSGACQCG